MQKIKINLSHAWAIEDNRHLTETDKLIGKKGKLYYSNEISFGLPGYTSGNIDYFPEWYEIAQQLYAIMKGWA